MSIDFDKYKIKFPGKPKVTKLRKPSNKYYRKVVRGMKRDLPRV